MVFRIEQKMLTTLILLSTPLPSLTKRNDEVNEIMRDVFLTSHPNHHQGRIKKPFTLSNPDNNEHSEKNHLCFPFHEFPHDLLLTTASFTPDLSKVDNHCSDVESVTFQQHLKKLGNPAECIVGNQLTTDNVGYGLGSVINSWTKPFMFAISSKLSFWSPPLGSYVDGKGLGRGDRCKMDSMACFFQPLSKCEMEPKLIGEKPGCWNSDVLPRRKCINKVIAENRSLDKQSLMNQKLDENGYPKNVPIQWRHNGHFWYTSQLLHYMLGRPNRNFHGSLERVKQSSGFNEAPRPMLSLHVRRGDSCDSYQEESKKRRCDSLSYYMKEAVIPLAKKYGIKSIFLATDDADTIAQANHYPQFTWVYVEEQDRSKVKKLKWEANLKNGVMDNYGEAQAALTDLHLLSLGDAFVGKFTSNLDRIAYSMLVGRKQGLAPYVSLDSNWCSDWGRKTGRSKFGEFYC
mmetsp:Transcript_11660/g.14064  ORF Transcript_11660/g.14064 Transcript_11660/m.14064 type:complete len:459 (-) Transcript_11660:154-1530(-)